MDPCDFLKFVFTLRFFAVSLPTWLLCVIGFDRCALGDEVLLSTG